MESPSENSCHSYNSIAGLRNIAYNKYRFQKQKRLEKDQIGMKVTEFKNSK